MYNDAEIIAIKVSTHKDLMRIINEIRRGNVIIASFSAFKSKRVRIDLIRRLLEAGKKMNFNVLGIGSKFMIIAPPNIKIRMGK